MEAACAFKFNFAFFEALGSAGLDVLAEAVSMVDGQALTIADAKRGDIGNSARFYAKSVFDDLGFDSVTVSPYMGRDSVWPFLQNEGTCTFILGRTSNPGGDDLQNLALDGSPLYARVGTFALEWARNARGEAGLVVGATDTSAMSRLRSICPDVPFLVPGIGAQGGHPEAVMRANAGGPILVNSSRSIIYASNEQDFARAAGRAARNLATQLQEARS